MRRNVLNRLVHVLESKINLLTHEILTFMTIKRDSINSIEGVMSVIHASYLLYKTPKPIDKFLIEILRLMGHFAQIIWFITTTFFFVVVVVGVFNIAATFYLAFIATHLSFIDFQSIFFLFCSLHVATATFSVLYSWPIGSTREYVNCISKAKWY